MEETNNNNNQTENNSEQNQAKPAGEKKDTLMAVLSYLGILIIIPFISAKDDPFVKFHIKQGLVLVVLWVAVWFIGMILPFSLPITSILNLGVFILAVIGIVNSVQGQTKELPIVGKYADRFKF